MSATATTYADVIATVNPDRTSVYTTRYWHYDGTTWTLLRTEQRYGHNGRLVSERPPPDRAERRRRARAEGRT